MTQHILRALPASGPRGPAQRETAASAASTNPDAGRAAHDDATGTAAEILSALRSAGNADQVAALTAALHAVLGLGRHASRDDDTRRTQAGPLGRGDPQQRAASRTGTVKAA